MAIIYRRVDCDNINRVPPDVAVWQYWITAHTIIKVRIFENETESRCYLTLHFRNPRNHLSET